MKIAYFECFAGAAGDMIVAAMLDAGLDFEHLKEQIATLNIAELEIKIQETIRCGLSAMSFTPAIAEQKSHRNLEQITDIINNSKIDGRAKKTAIQIFSRLAEAEAKVHNKDIQKIHFHEVGAVDAIVDMVSASIGLHQLGIEKVYCSTISVGGGTVNCQHGLLPVPAPATAEMIKGIPITAGPACTELLTPTAAAILTTITDRFEPIPEMKIEKIGYGAGKMRSEKFPNVLRLIIGQTADEYSADADAVCLLETNIDDATGELIAAVTDKLLDAGALDVFTTPIYMKQNRPAVKISVICRIKDDQQLEQLLLSQGISFGLRKQILQRTRLARDFVTVETKFGRLQIKTGILNGKVVTAKPEFSECILAAQKHSVSVKTVSDAALAAYHKLGCEK